MQVALHAAWREHRPARIRLVDAYESVGGVLGALANEAEAAHCRLAPDDQARLESVFVRLVRLGDTGGATRRTAALDEFDEARRGLLRRLGKDDYGRLVVVSATGAEIAHEALITQWPWLQGRLKDDARDVRRLDRLMEKAQEWRDAPAVRKDAYLAAGAERESFEELARQRVDWLAPLDRAFVEASNRAHESEREKQRRTLRIARHNEAVALTALANIEADRRPVNAAKLALAAWPRDSRDTMTPQLAETLDALGRIVPNLRERRALRGHGEPVTSAAFSPDGKRVVTASGDKTARLWDAETGREIAALKGHGDPVVAAAFSPDGKRVVTASWDNTARVWDAETGREIGPLNGHDGWVVWAAFSPDGKRVATASLDHTARVWDAESGREIVALKGHGDRVASAAFSPDGRRVVTASADHIARLWDAESGRKIAALKGHGSSVRSAAFSPNGKRVATASDDKTARIWDVSTIPKGNILQVACAYLRMHEDPVSLDGVTEYPLTFDRPICVTDPPPPDLLVSTEPGGGKMNGRHGRPAART